MLVLSTTDKVLSVIVSLAVSYIAAVFLKNLFKAEKVEKNTASISTFFRLSEIVERKSLNLFANMFSGSAAIAVFFTSYFISTSEATSEQLQKVLLSYAKDVLNQTTLDGLGQIFKIVPSPFLPAILLALGIALFFSYLKKGAELWRDAVHAAIDFRGSADDAIKDAADAFRRRDPTITTETFKDNRKQLPIPVELIEAQEETLFEYQLMYIASHNAPREGIDAALEKLLKRYRVIDEDELQQSFVKSSRTLVAISIFVFFALLYWSLTPQLSRLDALNGPKSWPNFVNGYFDLGIDLAKFALSIVFPFISGLALYEIRRKKRANRRRFNDDFIAVAGAQIISSLLIGILFAALYVARSYLHQEAGGKQLSLFQPRLIFDSLMPCIIAPTLLMIQIKLRQLRALFLIKLTILSLASGFLYGLISLCYGCFINEFHLSFLQETLMGFSMILAAYTIWQLIFSDVIRFDRYERFDNLKINQIAK